METIFRAMVILNFIPLLVWALFAPILFAGANRIGGTDDDFGGLYFVGCIGWLFICIGCASYYS